MQPPEDQDFYLVTGNTIPGSWRLVLVALTEDSWILRPELFSLGKSSLSAERTCCYPITVRTTCPGFQLPWSF